MSMLGEQIRQLKELADYWKSNGKEPSNALRQAADTIEALSEKLAKANMERSEAYYGSGWIPCGERLPDKDGDYICTQENYSLQSGKLIGKSVELVEFYKGTWRRAKNLKVMHWQPLPEPYTENEKQVE